MYKLAFIWLVLLSLSSDPNVWAGETPVSGVPGGLVGLSYDTARKILISRGNLPAARRDRSDNDCIGADEVCNAYPETEWCMGTGDRPCIFRWRTKNGQIFLVGTIGEVFTDLKVAGVAALRPGDLCFPNKC